MAHFVPSTADPTVWRQFVGDILGQRDHFLSRLKDAERSQEYYMDRCTKLRAKMRDLRSDNDEQLKAMRQQLEQCQGSEVVEAKDDSAEGTECVVCLEKPVQVALVPCGHVCACISCSSGLKICPMCRCAVEMRLELFFA